MPVIPKTVRTALEHVLEYLWDDESKHFEGCHDDEEANGHIFRSLQVVADCLNDDGDNDDDLAPDSPADQLELAD